VTYLKKRIIYPLLFALLISLSVIFWFFQQNRQHTVNQAETNNILYPARINDQSYEVFQHDEWNQLTIKGINMGMAKPGTFPGEAGISKEEYIRWFEQIGELNANTLRIYTLHPPVFYDALLDYNTQADSPIYLLHGVWIDEEPLEETLDAFDENITEDFQNEMRMIVDAVHGDAVVSPEPGHASGTYHSDLSPYVIGWVLGIEWYPLMVDQMDQDYPDLGDFDGSYIYTEEANPMEHWLAQQMDVLMDYEVTEYNSMRPLSFTNWVSTDNLEQPAEPNAQEDMASVDPNLIKTKGVTDSVGMFASYHVYPYYPDFLNLEEKYTEYIDHRGEENNYAGYLHDLNESHELPILIAEFGIPGSRGLTHENPFGWNQGFISESQQGQILTRLYEDILHENMLGGMIFTWQDEWFKRTWNTMDYDNPDRRPFWSNAQTNEQHFGLLSFDRLKRLIDGEDDWAPEQTLLEKEEGPLLSLSVDHDERYLYIKTAFSEINEAFLEEQAYHLYFSIRKENGVQIPVQVDSSERMLADFRLVINDKSSAKLEVAGDYDTFFYDYGERLEMLNVSEEELSTKENVFHPIRLALNREQVRPDTQEVLPFDYYETGVFRFGNANPDDPAYDSLADFYYLEETNLIEIRIPWMLLNAKDPSQKEFVGDLWTNGVSDSMTIDEIDIYASLKNNDEEVDSFGSIGSYEWETWDLPLYEERLKESYYIVKDLFSSID